MKSKSRLWLLEGIWWLMTCFIVFLVLLPILISKLAYPFLLHNIYFIGLSILWTRWLFLWSSTPYAWFKLLKLSLIFLMIPTVFMMIAYLSSFQNYIDEVGLQELVKELPEQDQDPMSKYIRTEMVFFGTSSIIAGILIPFKMIWSIWKQYNRNEV